MKRHDELKFADIEVTREDLARNVRKYEGMEYREGTTFVKRDMDGIEITNAAGVVVGRTNCFGLLLLVAKDCALLPAEFDENIPAGLWGQIWAKTLWEIIHLNFDEIDKADMNAGDLIMFRYFDVDTRNREPHHVGMALGTGQNAPFIHSSSDVGKVAIEVMDELFLPRLDSVWRMKNVVD